MRSLIDYWGTDWEAVGKRTLAHIPQPEHSAFVKWVSEDSTRLQLYQDTRGEDVVPLWFVSITRTQMNDQRLPEGF